MTPPDPNAAAAWIVAIITTGAAVFERLRNRKTETKTQVDNELLSDAKRYQERATLLGKLADDNAANFAREQIEHQKTRDFWHAKASEWQTTLTLCQDKLQEASERPDYKEIVEIVRMQSKTSEQIFLSIKQIFDHLNITNVARNKETNP